MAIELEKLATPTTIFGFLATSAGGVAMTAGDKTTQWIAFAICMACCYALAYVIPSRGEVVKKSDLAGLPSDQNITPADVLDKPKPKSDSIDFSVNVGNFGRRE